MQVLPVLHEKAIEFISHLAQWDGIEGCWEVIVPFPSKVTIEFVTNDIHEWWDAVEDIDEWFDQQEGLSYSLIGGFGDNKIEITGICW